MKDLFYCPGDKTLFWIAGYTADNSTHTVTEKIASLKANAKEFADHIGYKSIEGIKTFTVTNSRKYLHCRVFYIIQPRTIPADAFQMKGDWKSMMSWIEY